MNTNAAAPTLAQRLLLSLGALNVFGAQPSAITTPPPQWLGQHTNPERNEQRAARRHLDHLQTVKLNKYLNATQGS